MKGDEQDGEIVKDAGKGAGEEMKEHSGKE